MTRTTLEEGVQSLVPCEFSEFRWDGSSPSADLQQGAWGLPHGSDRDVWASGSSRDQTKHSGHAAEETLLTILNLTKGSHFRRWRSTQQIRDHLWTTLRTSGGAITLWASMTIYFLLSLPGASSLRGCRALGRGGSDGHHGLCVGR